MSIEVELRDGESFEEALRRFKVAVVRHCSVPYHKKLIKDLLTRGQKQRQKKLSAALKKRGRQLVMNPNYRKSV